MKAQLLFYLLIPLWTWCCVLPCEAAHKLAALSPAHSATARLTAGDGSRGTGTAFERSQGTIWLVTCAHVATSQTIQVEWFFRGHQSAATPGRVLWRDEGADVAVVAVPESALGGVLPPVIPLAPPDYLVAPGATVYTVGSAGGVWPTGFQGHARGYSDGDLIFLPPPANGRSGSAMLDDSGRIVGIVRARSQESGGNGIATPVQALYRLWGNQQQRTIATAVTVPMPPRSGAIPAQQPFRYQLPLPGVQRRQYADGFRHGQGQQGPECPPGQPCLPPGQPSGPSPNASGALWPTLPSGPQPHAPAPIPAPALDMGALGGIIDRATRPMTESLDRIEGSLGPLAAEAEQRRQDRIRDALPLDALGAAGGAAIHRDWSGVGEAMSGPEMAAWTAGGVGAMVAGFFGFKGLFAVLIKFAIAAAVRMGFSYVHGRIISPERTEVDQVIDDVKKPPTP